MLKVRQCCKEDKKLIQKFILELDNYHYNNCPLIAKEINKNKLKYYKQSISLVDKVDIKLFYILELNDNPIAIIMVWNNQGEITLINFYVKENYRNSGYGSFLLKYVINKIKESYCVLAVYEENKNSIDFYYKFGFKLIQVENTNEGKLLWLRYDKNIFN